MTTASDVIELYIADIGNRYVNPISTTYPYQTITFKTYAKGSTKCIDDVYQCDYLLNVYHYRLQTMSKENVDISAPTLITDTHDNVT